LTHMHKLSFEMLDTHA